MLNVAGTATNTQEAAVRIAIDPRPPIEFAQEYAPLRYAPEDRYSYYSPGNGTVNVFLTDTMPVEARAIGEPFPAGFLVMIQFQKALVNFDSTGNPLWSFPSAGRFVTVNDDEIFVSDIDDVHVVDVLDTTGQKTAVLRFDREVNYAKAVGDRLIVVYNDVGPAEVFRWGPDHRLGEKLFSSVNVSYGRSAELSGDRIAIADTYGQQVVVQSISSGAVQFESPAAFPNGITWRGDFLYVVEEHLDRVVALNLGDGSKHVVLAPPTPDRWNSGMTLSGLVDGYCGEGTAYPRSIASDICSGEFTLYAPNGIHLEQDGMWVADTDNARVIYVGADHKMSILTGLNGPVNVVPIH
ncbi:hypothetical protein FSC37_03190 [Piscinibacter aquaticus]|uniref:SMP-30/Gluconolactonase/LRE-like region domain-containing protein n=1 Tax=Piscinibacter aquaticus TaxID=392597 RepID=A0A5C6TY70_9BURK|nr:hypothetical protein FSC37_03190 [Piscinibacter aquaticus]